jgi:hypothetical protein
LEAGAMSDGSYVMEKDRSLTVMIPRAKYRPVQSTSVLTTFAPAAAGSPEQRLINYLDTGSQGKRKQSSSTERSRKSSAPMRKQSAGALVSAGFEVSAQVNRGGGGKHAVPADHHTMVSQRSGRTTLRTADNRLVTFAHCAFFNTHSLVHDALTEFNKLKFNSYFKLNLLLHVYIFQN